MGFLDSVKRIGRKADDLAEKHEEQIVDGIEKAADAIDDKTGNKHSKKVQQGAEKAKEQVRRMAEED